MFFFSFLSSLARPRWSAGETSQVTLLFVTSSYLICHKHEQKRPWDTCRGRAVLCLLQLPEWWNRKYSEAAEGPGLAQPRPDSTELNFAQYLNADNIYCKSAILSLRLTWLQRARCEGEGTPSAALVWPPPAVMEPWRSIYLIILLLNSSARWRWLQVGADPLAILQPN